MSWLAGAVSGSLDWDTGSFEQGFLRVEALTETFPSIVTTFMANPLLGLVQVAGSAMSAVVSTIQSGFSAVKRAFDASLENADRLNDLATNVGVPVEQLSALALVAQQAGSSLDEVADAYKFLGRNVAEAMEGGKNNQMASLFKSLGIELRDATGAARPLQAIMGDVADAMASIEEPAKRTNLAMTLFSRSGGNLIATLIQGSDELSKQSDRFERWGAVVSESGAKSADTFGDLLGVVSNAWTAIQNKIGQPLREALTPVLEKIVSWLDSRTPAILRIVGDTFSSIGNRLGTFAGQFGANWDSIVGIAAKAASFIVTAIGKIVSVLLWSGEMAAKWVAWQTSLLSSFLSLIEKIPIVGSLVKGLGAEFAKAADDARAMADVLKSVRELSSGVAEDLSLGIDKLAVATTSAGAPIPGAGGGSTTTNITVSPFSSRESSSEIAKKLTPVIQQAERESKVALEISARRALIEAGMSG